MAGLAGPGESTYTLYDRQICARAQVWLRERGTLPRERPWVLFVSFVAPHFPLTAPPEHYYRYFNRDLPMPKLYPRELRPDHPHLRDFSGSFCYDDYFESADDVKRALAGYFGLVSFLDENVGKLLSVLKETGLSENTRVLYTSDHGDNLGARGLWGKCTMYEEVAGVPLVLAGPGIPAGRTCTTPVSHVDAYPTIVESAGIAFDGVRDSHPGVSLVDIANGANPARTVLSEYHGMGSRTGSFMVRVGKWKYVHYVAYPPQLFDLGLDPEELHDLGQEPGLADVRAQCLERLRGLLDPEAVDRRAKARQQALIDANGGRDAVVARGDLGYTPAPGTLADFR
jgi:choline-sulfatase